MLHCAHDGIQMSNTVCNILCIVYSCAFLYVNFLYRTINRNRVRLYTYTHAYMKGRTHTHTRTRTHTHTHTHTHTRHTHRHIIKIILLIVFILADCIQLTYSTCTQVVISAGLFCMKAHNWEHGTELTKFNFHNIT